MVYLDTSSLCLPLSPASLHPRSIGASVARTPDLWTPDFGRDTPDESGHPSYLDARLRSGHPRSIGASIIPDESGSPNNHARTPDF